MAQIGSSIMLHAFLCNASCNQLQGVGGKRHAGIEDASRIRMVNEWSGHFQI